MLKTIVLLNIFVESMIHIFHDYFYEYNVQKKACI